MGPRPLRSLACVLVLVVAAAPAPVLAQLAGDLPIQLYADSSDIDRKNSRLVFFGVRVTQGELGISAASAYSTDLDFNQSAWVFRGDVQITGAGATIQADEATLEFINHRLRRARVDGDPVAFQRNREASEQITEGRAKHLDYDFENEVLELSGEAWLREGASQISGNSIVYNIADERVTADSDEQGEERVHITIPPPDHEDVVDSDNSEESDSPSPRS